MQLLKVVIYFKVRIVKIVKKYNLKKGLCAPFLLLSFLIITKVCIASSVSVDPKQAIAVEFSDEFLNSIEKEFGEYAKRRLKSWQKLITDNQNEPEDAKLTKVNNFFNLLQYRSDIAHWGVKDYWATPLEFIVSGAGDCEDYSIAKYFTLLKLGIDDKKLLITYVKALDYNQAHMVLTYYATPDSVPLVLDNLDKSIKSADKRKDLAPIYSFNGQGLWQAKSMRRGKKLGKADDMSRWRELEKRMQSGKISKFKFRYE